MASTYDWMTAGEIVTRVHRGEATVTGIVEAALARIAVGNPAVNAFTATTADRARAAATRLDLRIAAGEHAGPLAGVPFAVKNLFDVTGLATRAGSKLNRTHAPAARDAALIERLEAAGAVLVGALNMGEYAYDFTGENEHDGPSRNPHDLTRMTGGSSGGSAAAVASGLVPLALGSDTNGSIRVPASFCGLFGLKPTYGRLSRVRTFPFVSSMDHLGPMARCVADLALAYDAMQGADVDDPMCARRDIEPTVPLLGRGVDGLRIGVAAGYFSTGNSPAARAAVERVAAALGASREIDLPAARRARAAAYVITAAEGAGVHLERLRTKPADFDGEVRDRLIAGAMVPAWAVDRAQRFRRWYRDQMLAVFRDEADVILAPSTPCTAPLLGQKTLDLDGAQVPLRANIGLYTQPISFVGLPVVAVPVPVDPLPIGVQIIAAPWREDIALRVAAHLETMGAVRAPQPRLEG